MLYGRTIENVREDLDRNGTLIREELKRATSRLTFALVIVGALAAFAVVYVVANTPQEK